MDFTNLDSEETLKSALNWISNMLEDAILHKEHTLTFTFKPTEQNSLEAIFNFVLKIKEALNLYQLYPWCILNNKTQQVTMKLYF